MELICVSNVIPEKGMCCKCTRIFCEGDETRTEQFNTGVIISVEQIEGFVYRVITLREKIVMIVFE